MDVLVFRTTVTSVENVSDLTPMLDKLAGKGGWNFALEDCDNILRIVSTRVHPQQAVQLLTFQGFSCEELE